MEYFEIFIILYYPDKMLKNIELILLTKKITYFIKLVVLWKLCLKSV